MSLFFHHIAQLLRLSRLFWIAAPSTLRKSFKRKNFRNTNRLPDSRDIHGKAEWPAGRPLKPVVTWVVKKQRYGIRVKLTHIFSFAQRSGMRKILKWKRCSDLSLNFWDTLEKKKNKMIQICTTLKCIFFSIMFSKNALEKRYYQSLFNFHNFHILRMVMMIFLTLNVGLSSTNGSFNFSEFSKKFYKLMATKNISLLNFCKKGKS